MRGIGWVVALVLVCSVAACGGGNKSTTSSTSPDPGTTPSPVAHVEIVAPGSVGTDTNSSITLTATVKDAGNSVLEGQTVTFSAASGSLQVLTATTNSAGEATAKLSVGGNKANRSISVTAKSGSASDTKSIEAIGTTLTVTGSPISLQPVILNTMQIGSTTTLTVVLKDAGGIPVSGATATVVSSKADTLSRNSATLDYSGTATFVYTGTSSGDDKLTVNAGGVTKTLDITVTPSADFVAVSPAANTVVATGSPEEVSFRYSGAGRPISFSTTRGTLSSADTYTDASGKAKVTVSSVNAGTASITATVTLSDLSTKSASLPLLFSGTTPATVTVQASPTTLAPNASGSTLNQSTVSAVVRDAANNPVANKTVSFSMVGTGGVLPASSATTDADGRASVQFVAGSNPTNVTVVAESGGKSGSAQVRVASTALFISIFRGIDMGEVGDNTYEVPFTLSVVDANGVAVLSQDIDLSIWPSYFRTGQMVWNGTDQWVSTFVKTCANEDVNRNGDLGASVDVVDINGVLDAGEDLNANGVLDSGEDIARANGRLDPGLPISIVTSLATPGRVRTNEFGTADFSIRYGKQYATWLYGVLNAKGTVSGTESTSVHAVWLPILIDDVGDEIVAPAARFSPYGLAGCGGRTD